MERPTPISSAQLGQAEVQRAMAKVSGRELVFRPLSEGLHGVKLNEVEFYTKILQIISEFVETCRLGRKHRR